MPVIRNVDRIGPPTPSRHHQMAETPAKELLGNAEVDGLVISESPADVPGPRLSVMVVREAKEAVPSRHRSKIIRDGYDFDARILAEGATAAGRSWGPYGGQGPPIDSAIGATFFDIREDRLLPDTARPTHPFGMALDQYVADRLMIRHGGLRRADGVILGFPDRRLAEIALRGLTGAMPGANWHLDAPRGGMEDE